MSPVKLDIRLLGSLEVVRDGEPVDLPPSRKARALLAYLVTTDRPQSRSSLCDLFWPDADDPRAGLRWGLSKVRAMIDGGRGSRVRTSADRVSIDTTGALVDLHRLRATVGDDPTIASLEDLRAAAETFRGDFLDGLDVSGCHSYEAWCLGMRESLRALRVSIHDRLVDVLREEPAEALPYALQRVSLEPLDEGACIAAMDLLGALGRSSRAQELYELCAGIRAEYLGASPSEPLEAARCRLPAPISSSDRDAIGAAEGAPAAARPVPPPPEHLPPISASEPPLVGREGERERLIELARLAGSESASQVVLISGEPGIGKTRLLRELAEDVRGAQGGWVLSGVAVETEEVRPYGPWRDVLRGVPESVLDGDLRSDLSGLVPGAGDRSAGPADRGQLFDAFAAALLALTRASGPGLLVLDDVQWLDESSAALLHYLTRTLAEAPLVMACAVREGELERDRMITKVIRSLTSASRLHRVRLDHLDAEATQTLVSAVGVAPAAPEIYSVSEGNPLYAIELARARQEGRTGTPASIEQELDDRLERLDPRALDLLTWAAALGAAFDLSLLTEVVGDSDPALISAIEELDRRGIVRPSSDDRYDFSHALLHEAAYRRLSVPTRRATHRRIARVLDGGSNRNRSPGTIAHHAELGGVPEMAGRAYVEAAEASVWVFAFAEAAELVERGLRQAERLPDEVRIPLQNDLFHVYTRVSMAGVRPGDLEDRVQRLTLEAHAAGLPEAEADGYFHLAALQYERGDYEGTHRSSVRSAEAVRETVPDARTAHVLADAACCFLLIERDLERARELADEAELLAHAEGSDIVQIPLARALLHHHDGELDKAADAFDEVVRLGRRVRDRWWESPAHARRVMVDLDRGDAEAALARAREAEVLASRLGDDAEAAFARGLAAVAAAMADGGGSGPTAACSIDDALAELRALDSLWKVAQVQAYAADFDLERGRPDDAGERAAEILRAGEALNRPGLVALARAIHSRCAILIADVGAAAAELERAGPPPPNARFPAGRGWRSSGLAARSPGIQR
jgi:DNA-binding SARP family transcriptional activator/tetratricopeptide (TPR) repeat protein